MLLQHDISNKFFFNVKAQLLGLLGNIIYLINFFDALLLKLLGTLL